MQSIRNKDWVVFPNPTPRAQVRLFCFPFAGGGASIFYKWARELPAAVEVCPVQLPGREDRLNEPPFKSMVPLVYSILNSMWKYLDRPFAFFGHSMGAMISFELTRQLQATNGPVPFKLFMSGSRAPHIPDKSPMHALPDAVLLEKLRSLNGTEQSVLENPNWLGLYLPLLRADLKLDEDYICPLGTPLQCPIVVFGGSDDEEVSCEELEAWRPVTSADFKVQIFPGGHFFLRTAESSLMSILASELKYVKNGEFTSRTEAGRR